MDTLDERGSPIRQYGRVIWKRLWLILAVVIVIMTIVGIDTIKIRPVYKATARLLIDKEHSDIISFEEAVGQNPVMDPMVSYSSYYQTQYKLLRSRSLARRVVRSLQLHTRSAFTSDDGSPTFGQRLTSLPAAWLGTVLHRLRHYVAPAHMPPASRSAQANPEAALVQRVLAGLDVEPIADTRLVDVSFSAPDPRLAAEVANAVTRLYLDHHLETRFAASQEAVDWLDRRVQDMREKVEKAELALQTYKEEHGAVSLEARQSVVVQQLAELSSALTKANTDFIGLQTLHREVQQAAAEPDELDAIPSVVQNGLIQTLRQDDAALQHRAAELEERWGPKHPGMAGIRAKIRAMRGKIRTEVHKVLRGISTDYNVSKARVDALRDALEAKKQEAQQFNKIAIQYGVLKREADTNKQLYNALLTSMKEMRISAGLKRNNLHIVDAAEVPGTPIKPRPVAILLRTSLVALVLGVGLALLLESLDTTIKTPEEAEQLLRLPIIGAVGRFKNGRRDASIPGANLVTMQQPRSQAAEAFKTLRANLLMNDAATPHKVFLVTSPHPKDGKTTVAANLAVAMAQMDMRVLLVDADLRNPRLHKIFEIDDKAGLSRLLLEAQYEDIMAQHVMANALSLVPAGVSPPNPSELLGSGRMRRFIEIARESYDMVIIDTPPLLAFSDALVASSLADGAIVVLRSGATPRQHARRILTQLGEGWSLPPTNGHVKVGENGQRRVLGLVMNFLESREGSAYYADDGYYDYHHRHETVNGTNSAPTSSVGGRV